MAVRFLRPAAYTVLVSAAVRAASAIRFNGVFRKLMVGPFRKAQGSAAVRAAPDALFISRAAR